MTYVTGRRPEGLTSPKRTSAHARPVAWPARNMDTMAAAPWSNESVTVAPETRTINQTGVKPCLLQILDPRVVCTQHPARSTQHLERRVLGCKTHLKSRCWPLCPITRDLSPTGARGYSFPDTRSNVLFWGEKSEEYCGVG